MRALFAIIFICLLASVAAAHEVRPAYLEIREQSAREYSILWKTPMRGDMRLSLEPKFSVATEGVTPVVGREDGASSIRTWRIHAAGPLRGSTLTIAGLEGTMTDALVRIEFLNGETWVQRLTPGSPTAEIPERMTAAGVTFVYLKLGVEHILRGIDHLLFVLALLLITRGTRRLVKTITAFTVAHSITLGLAALGFVHVPPAPVEAVIALSIVFVAAEILRLRAGRVGIAARAPWVVSFTFGLLHGFGFAGALSQIGLPAGNIPLALLFFNVGVEVGQLMFVAVVLAFSAAVRRVSTGLPRWTHQLAPYAIGSIAMFWVIQRVAKF